ncbi:hypothetical protein [Halobellus sp. Atlit-38R]|uniref:hypothetical protein n=1 Tax=Halobellus sp. Atlit-38R TaxID=2282131 RepID=UPI0011C3B57C|nr:hypothetical protein [Halobellus sp. Atlit-38R]
MSLLIGVAIVVGGVATADSGGDTLTVSPDVDVPDRTTSFNGNAYTITALGRAQSGTSVSVSTTVRTEGQYYLHLYNKDRQRIETKSAQEDTTVSFATENLEPGTYTFALERDGSFETIHPLVVPAFTISVEAPSEIAKKSNITANATLSRIESEKSIDSVEVVVSNDETTRRVEMQSVDSSTYQANISTDDLPAGKYQMNVFVRGTETINGNKEAIGVSDAHSLSIEEVSTTATPTETESTNEGGGESSGGEQPESDPTTTQITTSGTVNTTTTPEPLTTIPTPTTESPPSTAEQTSTESQRRTDRTTDNSLLQPNDSATPTSESKTTATTTGLGIFGAFPAFWGLILVILWIAPKTR